MISSDAGLASSSSDLFFTTLGGQFQEVGSPDRFPTRPVKGGFGTSTTDNLADMIAGKRPLGGTPARIANSRTFEALSFTKTLHD